MPTAPFAGPTGPPCWVSWLLPPSPGLLLPVPGELPHTEGQGDPDAASAAASTPHWPVVCSWEVAPSWAMIQTLAGRLRYGSLPKLPSLLPLSPQLSMSSLSSRR
jgi:hypothetical protein